MATTKEQAQNEIFEAVSKLIKHAERYSGEMRGSLVLNAALAYRHAAGDQEVSAED